MTTNTSTSPRYATIAAASGAAVAVVAGVAHGFGRDNETMYGATHIAVGHLLPVVVAGLSIVWLTALFTSHDLRVGGSVSSPWLSVAQVGLCLWSAVTGAASLGLYITARTSQAAAVHHADPTLARIAFLAAAVTMMVGLVGSLVALARAGAVPPTTVVLVAVGTPGAFFAGPLGDFALAVGLGWYVARAVVRSRAGAIAPAAVAA